MSTSLETLLAELTTEVRINTAGYIRLETVVETGHQAIRQDYSELRELVLNINKTQANQGERLTASETRIYELQHVHRELADLRADFRGLESQVISNAPLRTPWTAIVSSVVALGALLYAVFGK